MARDSEGNLIRPVVAVDDELITERHHAEHLRPERLAAQLITGQVQAGEVNYLDQTEAAFSLQEALDRIELAEERFMQLDPELRLLAGNDIRRFEEMLADPDQLDLLVEHGLPVVIPDSEQVEDLSTAPATTEAPVEGTPPLETPTEAPS